MYVFLKILSIYIIVQIERKVSVIIGELWERLHESVKWE